MTEKVNSQQEMTVTMQWNMKVVKLVIFEGVKLIFLGELVWVLCLFSRTPAHDMLSNAFIGGMVPMFFFYLSPAVSSTTEASPSMTNTLGRWGQLWFFNKLVFVTAMRAVMDIHARSEAVQRGTHLLPAGGVIGALQRGDWKLRWERCQEEERAFPAETSGCAKAQRHLTVREGSMFGEWLNAEPLSEVMEQSEDKQPSWSY